MKPRPSPLITKAQSPIKRDPQRAGLSIVEALLAVAVFGLLVTAFASVLIYGQEITALAGARTSAVYLAEEGFEATRNIRDETFTNLTTGNHGLAISSNQWTYSGSSDTTDSFTRVVNLTTIDTRRWSGTSTVTWSQTPQRSGTVMLETYFTNWQRNFGNWAAPSEEDALDLTGAADGQEIDKYYSGSNTYALVVRDTSAQPELSVVDVSNPASIIEVGAVELSAAANSVAVVGNYAAIASANNTAELQVVDLSSPSAPVLVGSLNLTSNTDAVSIAGTGTTVFLGRNFGADPEIYAISIATPSAPSTLSTLNLAESATNLALAQANQYLYVTTPNNSLELAIVDMSNSSSIALLGSYNGSGNADGTGVAAFSTTAALGRSDGAFEIIDVSTPSAPTLISSALDVGNQINDLAMGVGDIYVMVASETTGTPTMIVDISDPTTPTLLGSVAMAGNTTGIIWDYDLNRTLVAGTDNSSELRSVKPN